MKRGMDVVREGDVAMKRGPDVVGAGDGLGDGAGAGGSAVAAVLSLEVGVVWKGRGCGHRALRVLFTTKRVFCRSRNQASAMLSLKQLRGG